MQGVGPFGFRGGCTRGTGPPGWEGGKAVGNHWGSSGRFSVLGAAAGRGEGMQARHGVRGNGPLMVGVEGEAVGNGAGEAGEDQDSHSVTTEPKPVAALPPPLPRSDKRLLN